MSVDKKKISYLIDLGMKTAFNRGALKFAVELSRLNLEDKAVDVLKKIDLWNGIEDIIYCLYDKKDRDRIRALVKLEEEYLNKKE